MAASVLTLGGINLNAVGGEMRWTDKWHAQQVAQSVVETLGGGIIVNVQAVQAGQRITLVADEQYGWLSKATVEAVKEMADEAGGIFSLIINGVEYTVMFRHHEPPACDFQPLRPQLNEDEPPHNHFTGTIKLITV